MLSMRNVRLAPPTLRQQKMGVFKHAQMKSHGKSLQSTRFYSFCFYFSLSSSLNIHFQFIAIVAYTRALPFVLSKHTKFFFALAILSYGGNGKKEVMHLMRRLFILLIVHCCFSFLYRENLSLQ